MSFLKALSIGFVVFALAGCDKARMNLANNTGAGDPPNKKVECGSEFSSIAVFNEQGELVGSMTPWQGDLSAMDNYNYNNLSGDPVVGPKASLETATQFIYENANGRFLFLLLDQYSENGADREVDVTVVVKNNNKREAVVISDEAGELKEADEGENLKVYHGHFDYDQFSDGGVIGPLVGSDWEITLQYNTSNQISSTVFADHEVKGVSHSMELGREYTIRPEQLTLCDLPQQ